MASRNRGSVVEMAYAAAEAGRRAAAETEKNNQLARARIVAAERARKEEEPEARRERARIAAVEDRARREEARRVAEKKERRAAEARRAAEDRARTEAEARKRRASDKIGQAPADFRRVLQKTGMGDALEKSKEPLPAPEPQSLGSFLSHVSSNWHILASLLQKQNLDQPSKLIDASSPRPPATPIAPPQVTVDKKLIFAFINYSNPQDYTEYDQYFRACDFLRGSQQNFEAFKEDLKKDLKKDLEEGQVKVKAGDILKRAEDVRGLTINSRGEDEYEESKRLKNQDLQKKIEIERQKKENKVRKKAENSSQVPEFRGLGLPPIHLPPHEPRWSEKEFEARIKSANYALLQVKNGTAFSKEGLPGKDAINWGGIFKGEPLVRKVYSPNNPPHHIGKEGIGFNQSLADTEISPKERRMENTNLGYLWWLQEKFDKDNNNFDINASVDPDNSTAYIRGRVAKWEKESRQFKIETTTNPSNLMEYCEYLMNNIEDLKHKESEKSGEEIDKSKLKTLIAFQYLELGKIIYAGTWGNTLGELNRDDDSSTQKPDIIREILVTVPQQYQDYLKFNSRNVALETHNSISLPRRNPLNSSKNQKEHRGNLESLANSRRIESTFVPRTYEGNVDYDKKHKKMLKRGEMLKDPLGVIEEKDFGIESTLKKVEVGISNDLSRLSDLGVIQSVKMAASKFSSFLKKSSSLLTQASDQVEQRIAKRVDPATIRVPADQKINENTGLGYVNTNADARAHDEKLLDRRFADTEFQPDRGMRPDALARRNEASKEERYGRQVNSGLREMYSETNGDFCIRERRGNPFGRPPSMREKLSLFSNKENESVR